jgi:arylsulfatase A-like enzyme
LFAGCAAGLGFGLVDGAVAARLGPDLGTWELVGCLSAALTLYVALYVALGLAFGLLLQPVFGRRTRGERFGALFGLLFAIGAFLEAYWWTRPWVYYGLPATSPERLLSAAAMAIGALALGWLLARGAARLPRAWIRGIAVWALAAAGLGLVTWWQSWQALNASTRGTPNARNQRLPNVLLFVVDALRADVLEPYGHPRVKTPNTQRLAESGVLFENAFVQAPYTWTSFGSLLTGKYPRRHGLVAMDPRLRMRLDENVTLPWHLKHAAFRGASGGERLADGDYAGATFMTGTLSQGSGLMHGFDWYFEAMAGHDLVALDSRFSVFRSQLLVYLWKSKLTQRFKTSAVATTAVDWLRQNEGKRFLGMVHLYSTHTPYDPEEEFRRQYCDPGYTGPIRAFYAEHRIALEQGKYAPTEADIEQIRNLYYAGTAQADRDIGLVLAELERQGVLQDTLVILTADHGEELSDHAGYWEHNWMFQTNLRVPLIIAWPEGLPANQRVAALVESIDVFPTVCELLGLELPAQTGEYARLDGQSLVPLIRGEVERVKEFSFAENGLFASVQDDAWKLVLPAAALGAAATNEEAAAPAEGELYHLAQDPGETRNVLAEEPEQARRLFAVLSEWSASMPIPRYEMSASERDLESQELWRKLGYTESTGAGVALPEDAQRE